MDEKEQNKQIEVIPYKKNNLMKSNYLIGTKYRASVMENKVTYIAMLKIQDKEYDERPDGIYVSMSASEIREMVDYKSGSFYEALKKTADAMTGNNMGIVDDENERFEFITLVNKATYDSGTFTIRFASDLKDNLINIRKNFTNLPAGVVLAFKKPYSFPLYQLLKSECYYPASYHGPRDNVFSLTVGLSELKLDMGVVDSNSPSVKKLLREGSGTEADFDRAVEREPEKMFNRWVDFDRKCLRPTVDEINEKSDIHVEYAKKTAGKGGKVRAVEFTVWLDGAMGAANQKDIIPVILTEDGQIEAQLTDQDKFVIALEVATILTDEQLDYDAIVSICEAANYNKEIVANAYDLLCNTGTRVNNVTGWLIAAIKGGYSAQKREARARANGFGEFDEREHDQAYFDNLEQNLLNN